jgi:hypothetical protein
MGSRVLSPLEVSIYILLVTDKDLIYNKEELNNTIFSFKFVTAKTIPHVPKFMTLINNHLQKKIHYELNYNSGTRVKAGIYHVSLTFITFQIRQSFSEINKRLND